VHPTPSRSLRALLALFAVVALLGACGGDDGDASDSTNEESEEEGSDGSTARDESGDEPGDDEPDGESSETLTDDPCSLLDLADLSAVTGLEFDVQEPGRNRCTYSSSEGAAAIALNIAPLNGADPQDAIDAAVATCDAGTVEDLEFTASDGGFGCLVNGIATVAATGEGLFAVLTGATIDPNVGTDQILQDLATILEDAIAGG
jgi:hypothetical protein